MLVKYRPFSSLLSPFFGNFGEIDSYVQDSEITPKTDIIEREGEYAIYVEMPGVKKGDFKVDLKDGMLCIFGKKDIHQKSKNEAYISVERQCGQYVRTFRLGEEIDSDNISAKYEDGVLQVSLPKTQREEAKPVEIKVD